VPIRLYNTLTKQVEPFAPDDEDRAQVYASGLTPSDAGSGHAGHARTFTTFDVLTRHLRARGYKVEHHFPGSEERIARSKTVWGVPLTRVWMNEGFESVVEEVSEPAHTFASVDDLLVRNDPEALRYFFLGAHYRAAMPAGLLAQEGSASRLFPELDAAEARVEYLYTTRDVLVAAAEGKEPAIGNVLQGQAKVIDGTAAKVLLALDHDLDTPQALAALVEFGKAANEVVTQIPKLASNKAAQDSARQLAARAIQALDGACAPLGLMHATGEAFAARTRARRLKRRGLDARIIAAKVQARAEARAGRDFARADALRKELAALGIEVSDAGNESSWRVAL
jgi:cysteinyl-tRNA synthetase